MEPTITTQTTHSIDVLNSFLRGELSACETYRQALEKLAQSPHRARLGECQKSHQTRVALLREKIREIGGKPVESSGAWGAFAKLIEGGAKLFGEKAAIAALEEGEDHGRDSYKRDLVKLDPETRRFIETKILPEQQHTHDSLSALKTTLH